MRSRTPVPRASFSWSVSSCRRIIVQAQVGAPAAGGRAGGGLAPVAAQAPEEILAVSPVPLDLEIAVRDVVARNIVEYDSKALGPSGSTKTGSSSRRLHDIRLVLDNRSIGCLAKTGMSFSITEI
jgi:hypothetical protein